MIISGSGVLAGDRRDRPGEGVVALEDDLATQTPLLLHVEEGFTMALHLTITCNVHPNFP